MCNAGIVTMTVRNWVNENAADPYALSYNCLVCTKTGCTPAATLTTASANLVGAAVDATKKGTLNLAGAGT